MKKRRKVTRLTAWIVLVWLPSAAAIAGTHTWTGGVSALWSDDGNWSGGSPAGDPSADLIFPSGVSNLSTTNDIAGTTYVSSITFSGSGYTLGGTNPLALANGTTDTGTSNAISLPLSLYGGASHKISSYGHLTIAGPVSGDGLEIWGLGIVEFSGDNTFAGLNQLAPGVTLINGSQPSVSVSSCWGLVAGSGTAGDLFIDSFHGFDDTCYGTLLPGPATGTGVLHAGNFIATGSSVFTVRINGPNPGIDYDQLDLRGYAAFGTEETPRGLGYYPQLSVALGYTPPIGTTFTIIKAPGGVTGPLAGGDGALIAVDALNFQIHYTADAVTLTRVGNGFNTVTPCRLVDTRNPDGAYGGPPVAGQGQRFFVAQGQCGVPVGAKAISVNVTVTQPATPGDLRIYPWDLPAPSVSLVNYSAGQTRANNAILPLSRDGLGGISVQNDGIGTVQLIVDVNGYFQ